MEHDAMVDVLMQKQIFYVYLTQKYEIAWSLYVLYK